jgi:hypothetical protein
MRRDRPGVLWLPLGHQRGGVKHFLSLLFVFLLSCWPFLFGRTLDGLPPNFMRRNHHLVRRICLLHQGAGCAPLFGILNNCCKYWWCAACRAACQGWIKCGVPPKYSEWHRKNNTSHFLFSYKKYNIMPCLLSIYYFLYFQFAMEHGGGGRTADWNSSLHQ